VVNAGSIIGNVNLFLILRSLRLCVRINHQLSPINSVIFDSQPLLNMKHTDNSPQLETPASAPMAVLTNRAAYLASNPEARRVHEEHMAEFREKVATLGSGNISAVISEIRRNNDLTEEKIIGMITQNLPAKSVMLSMIYSAEKSRQIGITLLNWSETLPGRRLTVDLYEQHKHELVDPHGRIATYQQIMWWIDQAKKHPEPIVNLYESLKCYQGLLIANSLGEKWEDSNRRMQKAVPPPDPLVDLKKILDPASLKDTWKRLQANSDYFHGGHLREDLRDTLIEDFRPVFELVEQIKREFAV